MEFDWEKIKPFIPLIFIVIVGFPVLILGRYKRKDKPENEETK